MQFSVFSAEPKARLRRKTASGNGKGKDAHISSLE
jgi:hypothetical protein